MSQLLSFHNDKNIKKEYVKRLKLHAKADEIIKGQYWQDGKGCAVGCTIHSSDHSSYETELGVPEWLAILEDTIFEGLSNKEAKKFAVDFLLAIPVGVDLNKIKYQFCSFILKENINQVLKLALDEKLKQQIVESIQNVLSLHEKAIKIGVWDMKAARSAAEAAAESAWSAESAARSAEAAWSAEAAMRSARSAEWAAEAAWSAARSAAEAARSAAEAARSAESAARSAESAAESAWSAESSELAAEYSEMSTIYSRYAKELLRLLKRAK